MRGRDRIVYTGLPGVGVVLSCGRPRVMVRAASRIRRQQRHSSIPGRAYQLWRDARKRAAKRGLEFSITKEFVEDILTVGRCAVTGVPFDLSPGSSSRAMKPHAPSLDRITPARGYTPSNTRCVTTHFNVARGGFTDRQLVQLARSIIRVSNGNGRNKHAVVVRHRSR